MMTNKWKTLLNVVESLIYFWICNNYNLKSVWAHMLFVSLNSFHSCLLSVVLHNHQFHQTTTTLLPPVSLSPLSFTTLFRPPPPRPTPHCVPCIFVLVPDGLFVIVLANCTRRFFVSFGWLGLSTIPMHNARTLSTTYKTPYLSCRLAYLQSHMQRLPAVAAAAVSAMRAYIAMIRREAMMAIPSPLYWAVRQQPAIWAVVFRRAYQ